MSLPPTLHATDIHDHLSAVQLLVVYGASSTAAWTTGVKQQQIPLQTKKIGQCSASGGMPAAQIGGIAPPVQAKLTQTMVLQSLLQTTCSWLQPRKPNRLRCRGEMPQQSASNDQAGGERNVWVAPPPARAVLQGRTGCSRCSVGCSWAVAIGGCALSGRIVHCAC